MSRTLTHTEHEKLRETKDKAMFGLWIYLMTDLMLFASLFATYVVLRNNTASGPTEHEIFSLPFVFVETMLLLASSFVVGLAVLAFRRGVRLHGLILLPGLIPSGSIVHPPFLLSKGLSFPFLY